MPQARPNDIALDAKLRMKHGEELAPRAAWRCLRQVLDDANGGVGAGQVFAQIGDKRRSFSAIGGTSTRARALEHEGGRAECEQPIRTDDLSGDAWWCHRQYLSTCVVGKHRHARSSGATALPRYVMSSCVTWAPSMHMNAPRATAQLDFEAVLFDVDGTLIDSNAAHAQAWTEALREQGVGADVGQVRALIGMGADKLLPAVADVSADSPVGQAIAQRKKELFNGLLPDLQSTPGARALLEYLRARGTQLVIATSADDREMEALLQRAGVADLIPQRASKDDVSESKPDPDIVHAAWSRTGAARHATVMIGDTPYDIEAARRAGIRALALRCGGHWSDDDLRGAVAIFDDPAALLAQWRSR
jgi:HAD superfamily hydrolase (TIGR01509 family)